MASVNRIDSVYDVAAIAAEQKSVEDLVRASIEQIKAARTQSIDFNVNTKSLGDYNAKLKELEKGLAGMAKATDAASKASVNLARQKLLEAKTDETVIKTLIAEEKAQRDATKAKQIEEATVKNLQREQEKLIKQRERETKLLDQAENDYLQLSKAYNDAALKAKNYALQLGESHPVTVAAIADAKTMGDTLKRLDATVGQHQRNVGNYTQATFALTQVLREAPAFANSFATGISAIGNNVPLLVDQFKILRTEVGSGFKALKILGGSLLSFQALLPIGFLLLQSYGKELFNFIGSLTGSADAAELSAKALEKYNSEIETGRNRISALAEQIQFLNTLGRINLEINFGEGFELLDLQAQSVGLSEKLAQVGQELIKLQAASDDAFAKFQEGTLLEADYTKAVEANSKRRAELQTDEAKLQKEQAIIFRQIALQRKKDEDEAAKKRKEARDKAAALRERDRVAEFELLKANLELNKEYDLKRANDEKSSFQDRVSNIINYGADSKKLIEAQAKFDLATAGLTAKERLKIENDKNNALIRLSTELGEKLAKITANAFKVDTSELADSVKGMTGTIAKQIQDYYDKLAKRQADAKKAAEDLKRQLTTTLTSLATEIEGLFFDIFTNAIERQKNAIQDQIDLLEKQKQKDIEVANQTITNAQDRADAITVIEARAAAKRQQLELKQRQLDQQKARFEKARVITEIIQSTSLAVVNALTQVKTLGPGAIALAALIGTLGAVQIARALAAPIPRYKHGTESHPGGLAVVGDGGKSEGVLLPDGTRYKTPATDTLVDLPKGAKVFPDYADMVSRPVISVQAPDTTAELQRGFGQVVTAIKKIPQPIIRADRAWTQAHKTGSNFRNYLNRSI